MADRMKALERPRYFPRQMITTEDLSSGVSYVRERMRRHNRALHGWGIVYGLAVTPVAVNGALTKLQITPGFALTPQGDEIEVLAPQTYDTTKEPTPETDADGNDPWSSDVFVDRRDSGVKYLAIRYQEMPTRQIRVAPSACDCGTSTSCEYSRIQDAYDIELLDTLPASYQSFPTAGSPLSTMISDVIKAGGGSDPGSVLIQDAFGPGLPVAPAAIADPWIILADVGFNGGVVTTVDPLAHRRMVVSAANLWWRPTASLSLKKAEASNFGVSPKDASRTQFTLTLTGTGLSTLTQDSLSFLGDGGKLKVESIDKPTDNSPPSDTTRTAQVSFPTASADAVKLVTLRVIRPDGFAAISNPIAITIPPASTTSSPTAAPPPPASGGVGGH